MDQGARRSTPLLGKASGSDAAHQRIVTVEHAADLGDIIVMLLASTLAGLSDRLASDGFEGPADLVGELVEVIDGYLVTVRG
jgi:hypothetical protein